MPRISITEPGKDSQAYSFAIKRMAVSIGRSSSNDITIAHRSVSKKHGTIERHKGGLLIVDHDSTNGTMLDGEKLDQFTLTNGMEFEIGDVPVVFTLTNEECDILTAERFKIKQEEKETQESND